MPVTPEGNQGHTDSIWQRIDAVIVLILENDKYLQSKRGKDLTKVVKEKFKTSSRTAHRIIAEAKKELRKLGDADKKKAFVKAIRDREYLYQQAKTEKDYKLALEVVRDRDKLNGLYVDEVIESGEVTIKNIDMSKFTEHGLERLKRGDKVEEVLMDPKAVKQQ